jgi:hypothetical protein
LTLNVEVNFVNPRDAPKDGDLAVGLLGV